MVEPVFEPKYKMNSPIEVLREALLSYHRREGLTDEDASQAVEMELGMA